MITIRELAQVCYDANKAYCVSRGELNKNRWGNIEEWRRESVMDGVRCALDFANPMPEDLHGSWRSARESEGWSYNKQENSEDKHHPCLIPFDELPKDRVEKYKLFIAVVKALGNEAVE